MTVPAHPTDTLQREAIKQQALALKLHGLIAHWDALPEADLPVIQQLIAWEDLERKRRDWNGDWGLPTSVASSRWRTSTGVGRSSVTGRQCLN